MVDHLGIADRYGFGVVGANAVAHIRIGLDVIDDPRLAVDRSAPVLTLLSTGFEHLVKATWLAAQFRVQGTPTRGSLTDMGHRLGQILRSTLDAVEQVDPSSASPGLQGIPSIATRQEASLARIRSDENTWRLINALDAYAQAAGRYAGFDQLLAESTQEISQPTKSWEATLQAIWEDEERQRLDDAKREGLEAYLAITKRYPQESSDLARRILVGLRDDIVSWWSSGLLGEAARAYAPLGSP